MALLQNKEDAIARTALLHPKFTVKETHSQFEEVWVQLGQKHNFEKSTGLNAKVGRDSKCKIYLFIFFVIL